MQQKSRRHFIIRFLVAPILSLAALPKTLPIFAQASPRDSHQTIVLDGAVQGKLFEGVGAVSGGGATSVLLKDYPEPQRSQILDILFKPKFAASMQTLYIEVGGDGNSTQGTEPTHMRSRTDENYTRGYEWWLMVEAKRRSPALTLDGCAWSCPGWIGDGEFWSQDMCDYYVKWIKGLKTQHGLDLDTVGCRNEKGTNPTWVKMFRKTLNDNHLSRVRIHAFDNPGKPWMWDWIPQLNTDQELVDAVDIIGNHCLPDVPLPASVRETIAKTGKPIWDTEEHVYNESNFYKDEYACAIGAVHLFNVNYIEQGATKIVNWYLCGSTYPAEPYYQQPPAMFASNPWSGYYRLKPIIWTYAHYGQFTQIGWRYISSGCTALAGGGTAVTLKSDSGDYSVIVETSGAAEPQTVQFQSKGGLSQRRLCVWKTTREAQFVRQADIVPFQDGSFGCTLEPDAIYSISTTAGQHKGEFSNVPAEQPFPFPYCETFDHYSEPEQWGYLPHYTADICGVFEVVDRPDKMGKCLRQVIDRKAQSWAPEWKPYTVLGDAEWTDYDVSADILFDAGGWAGVMGRINSTGDGYNGSPKGYYARINGDGSCGLYIANHPLKGTPEQQLAAGNITGWQGEKWHNVKMRFEGANITLIVDDSVIARVADGTFAHGMAGLMTGGEDDKRNTAYFDNLTINRVNGAAVKPTLFPQDRHPIYKRKRNE